MQDSGCCETGATDRPFFTVQGRAGAGASARDGLDTDHGQSTTNRLDRAFWTVLDKLAEEEGVTVAALVTRIHDHCLVTNDRNLASVSAGRLSQIVSLGA